MERVIDKINTTKKEKEVVQAQFEALRNQLNPHFFFNSLNSLSSLIYKDAQLSDKFINRFSEIFRYSLEKKDSNYSTLRDELKFIEAYMFLQKTRHGANLLYKHNIHLRHLDQLIPALSLQIIIENAFKHNAISTNQPLEIELSIKDDFLEVSNTYNPRSHQKVSGLMGQKNLKNRYMLVGNQLPKFYVEEGFYYANLPLLNPTIEKSRLNIS